MKMLLVIIVSTLCCTSAAAASLEDFLGGEPLTRERIIRDLMDYYMRDDPVGIPVLQIPDPLTLDANVTSAVINLYNLEVSGLSQFKLQYVNVNVTNLKMTALLRVPRLQVLSTYYYSSFFSTALDDSNITFTGLELKIKAQLDADFKSELYLSDMTVDIEMEELLSTFANAPVDLNIGVTAAEALLMPIIDNIVAGKVAGITEKVNERLSERFKDKRFPVGVSPVDMLVAGLKEDLRHKMDPLTVANKVVRLPAGMTLNATNISVTGLSTIHRHGEVSLQLIDDRLLLVLQLGSQAVSVQAEVEISVPVLPAFTSSVEFTIDSFVVWVELQQSADVRHPPQLRRMHITLGNFRLLSSGESSLSYLLEAAVNGLPNALRGPITKAVEPLLHKRIQQRLYALDIEEILNKQLEEMENQNE